MWIISDEEKKIISSLVAKGKEEQERNDKFAFIDFDRFYKLFNSEEIEIIEKYLAINPKKNWIQTALSWIRRTSKKYNCNQRSNLLLRRQNFQNSYSIFA